MVVVVEEGCILELFRVPKFLHTIILTCVATQTNALPSLTEALEIAALQINRLGTGMGIRTQIQSISNIQTSSSECKKQRDDDQESWNTILISTMSWDIGPTDIL